MIDLAERDKLDDTILEIALKSLEAGEALVPIAEARPLAPVPYKYGMHLPNWFNGWSDGLKRELEATLPVSLTFLDNVKGEGLVQAVDVLHRHGVKPELVYRPYFPPGGGVNGAIVEGYANGAVIKMRDDYFRHPLLKQAYDEGRFIVKFFNETNIGGEGFPRGRAGFASALHYWKQARGVMKAAYPGALILSICNTPGNDDVWFSGDTPNAPYWYHGPEAAKANPTQSDIAAAIASCPFREMFSLCDVIGGHAYGNLTRSVSGDLQTWYSRRPEQYLKFLGPYLAQGKKLIINEWDMGYDDGQEARARDVVYALANIVGPNPALWFVNHWWNGDDGEGAGTWEKHQTRKGGEFRPVVLAVKAFRESAGNPGDPPPPPPNDPTLETVMLEQGAAAATVPVTPGFALFDKVIADGLLPNGPEKYVTHSGKNYALRSAEHPSNGGAYVYYVEIGRWGEIRRLVRRPPVEPPPVPPPPVFSIDRQYINWATLGKNYSHRPAGARVRGIVLHHTGGGFRASLNTLTSPTSGVGVQYLIDVDGSIYQLTEDTEAAWHAGYSILNGLEDANAFTLGYEIVNKGDGKTPYPPIQQAAVVWLLKHHAAKYGFGREWVDTHKNVRAAYLRKYPGARDANGRPISNKPDPAGLNVEALLNAAFG